MESVIDKLSKKAPVIPPITIEEKRSENINFL